MTRLYSGLIALRFGQYELHSTLHTRTNDYTIHHTTENQRKKDKKFSFHIPSESFGRKKENSFL